MTAFTKMHGCGNDFIVVGRPWQVTPDRARALCDRRMGVGADGVIVIGQAQGGAWPVTVHNADGSIADACGNGYRCVARYLCEREGVQEVRLATPGGIVRAWRDDEGYAVELPAPTLGDAVRANGRTGRAVRAGNPNVVVYVDELEALDLEALASEMRASAGPANVEAVIVRSRDRLSLRVHERGAGETLACGTGSCAAVATALADGRVDGGTVVVEVRGGTLRITPGASAYVLAGPAAVVYEGDLA